MDIKTASERLRNLASSERKRSKAARLREVIDDVEFALAAGVTRAAVLAELSSCGLDMSMATFETNLKRIRAKVKQSINRSTPFSLPSQATSNTLASPSPTTPPALPISAGQPPHDPVDIDSMRGSKVDPDASAKHAKLHKQ